jgi:hypothetical protein
MYRRRRDIEVFFRFPKQELSFSHFISLNRNGIEVMYMTLITAMPVMIYRKENGIGFGAAKRRMLIELQELTLAAVAVIGPYHIRVLRIRVPDIHGNYMENCKV